MPGLLKLYRSKKGALGEKMEDEVLLCLTFLEEYEYAFFIRETEKDVGFSKNTLVDMCQYK